MQGETSGGSLRGRLRTGLREAMAARNAVAVAALRSAIGAIDNAEAVDATPARPTGPSTIAKAVVGLGAGDVPRRELSEPELVRIVRREVDERRTTADDYERADRPERAERLRAEAAVLAHHLAAS